MKRALPVAADILLVEFLVENGDVEDTPEMQVRGTMRGSRNNAIGRNAIL